MGIFDVLNGSLLYVLVGIGLIIMFMICLFFFIRARRRVFELGVSKGEFSQAMKSAAIFSVIPSVSVIIGLISLSPLLGVPWPWFRLSVVGSLSYELMSADLATSGAGYSSLAEFAQSGDVSSVGTIMFVMSIAIMAGMLFNLVFLKNIHSRILGKEEKQGKAVSLVLSSLTIGMMSVFVPVQFLSSKIHAITLLASALLTYILGRIAKNHTWLNDYIMSFALVFGMAVAVIVTNIM